MKRRVYQVTRFSKKVDHRLKRLKQRLDNIEKLVDFIEKNLPPEEAPEEVSNVGNTITYTIKKEE